MKIFLQGGLSRYYFHYTQDGHFLLCEINTIFNTNTIILLSVTILTLTNYIVGSDKSQILYFRVIWGLLIVTVMLNVSTLM